ncbi:MAG: imidazole glycerol phosphate synthase subunit HisH [Planctomycetales bacterium]
MLAIIDYQMGNLRSVQKAFERVGQAAIVSDDPAVLSDAEKLVLPGVGAFEDAMVELERRKLVAPILDAIAAGRPLLGICLGLQLLFDVSHENGKHVGLGAIPGEVVPFQDLPPHYKIPHMGWNQLKFERPSPLMAGLDDRLHCYFVHSYYVIPADEDVIATRTEYYHDFTSMIWRDNVHAMQFHPEKSQANGLQILRNFARL